MIKINISIPDIIKRSTTYIVFLLLFITLKSKSQPPQAISQSYIGTYANEAIHQMVEFRIPASVILAQAILESASGSSNLAKRSNNHFGIKCHKEWGGDTIRKNDDTLNECFRSYNNVIDSYNDHSLFLKSRPRYRELFKLSPTDYKGWCYGLKNVGYATYTCYTEELIDIIEKYELYEFDRIENLSFKPLEIINNNEIYNYPLNPEISLENFFTSDLLWYNESDLLNQELDFLTEPRYTEDLIVENVKFKYRSGKVKF